MASADTKKKLMSLGVFASPLVLVMVAKSYLGTAGPTSAQAQPVAETSTEKSKKKGLKAPTFTEKQLAASKHAEALKSQPMNNSPFFVETRSAAASTPTDSPVDVPVFETDAPKFTVQAILSSSTGKTALIDGKACRENEKVRGTEWEVTAIDAEARSVTLRDTRSDRTVTVKVETPKLESGKTN